MVDIIVTIAMFLLLNYLLTFVLLISNSNHSTNKWFNKLLLMPGFSIALMLLSGIVIITGSIIALVWACAAIALEN